MSRYWSRSLAARQQLGTRQDSPLTCTMMLSRGLDAMKMSKLTRVRGAKVAGGPGSLNFLPEQARGQLGHLLKRPVCLKKKKKKKPLSGVNSFRIHSRLSLQGISAFCGSGCFVHSIALTNANDFRMWVGTYECWLGRLDADFVSRWPCFVAPLLACDWDTKVKQALQPGGTNRRRAFCKHMHMINVPTHIIHPCLLLPYAILPPHPTKKEKENPRPHKMEHTGEEIRLWVKNTKGIFLE